MWKLIDNDTHDVQEFSTVRALLNHAEHRGIEIKKSPTDNMAYCTIPATYVPVDEWLAELEKRNDIR